MKGDTNNLQIARWTDDPAQQEKFLTEVAPRIDQESNYMTRIYGVPIYREDIASEIRATLLQQMVEIDTNGPFAKDSPKEAADFFLEKKNYRIREWARERARKEADKHKKQSRQADILANVRQRDLPQDSEAQLFAIVKSLPLIASATPNFTPRDRDIWFKEMARQIDLDDLSAEKFDQAAQALGVSSSELRSYFKDHDEHGHLSARDRKALSRARAKVSKALTRAALTSLLVIVFALSLALGNAIRLGRSIHQKDVVNQGGFTQQNDLVCNLRDIHQ